MTKARTKSSKRMQEHAHSPRRHRSKCVGVILSLQHPGPTAREPGPQRDAQAQAPLQDALAPLEPACCRRRAPDAQMTVKT